MLELRRFDGVLQIRIRAFYQKRDVLTPTDFPQ
jgi:hypothetical protein